MNNLAGAQEVNWSVYSCAQNLPAILNDPKRGKQKDFFTRTWGDSFVETAPILPSPRLEQVPSSYFTPYCKKLLKRYKKLQERKASSPTTSTVVIPPQDSIHPLFTSSLSREASSSSSSSSQHFKPESSPIPRIYFTQNFNISNLETFREIYSVDTDNIPSKLIQDKLSHYLDLVEVGLAQQISKKSSAFFSAVSTQDKVAEKVSKALVSVRQIKEELAQVKKDEVETPLHIIKLAKRKENLIALHQKLQLMATVHQAQRAIQSLLGNSDYVGALLLISTTQDVLRQELQGLVSFRYLDSQLVEIRNAIEKMLRAELERNLSADLNRPTEQMITFYDKDRLVSIILGFLRLGKIAPIVTVLAKEISTAMTATCKQTLIEAVSESDSKSDSLIGSTAIQLAIPQLSSDLWIKMISQLSEKMVQLLQHTEDVILLFQSCGDSAVGHVNGDGGEGQDITETEDPIISNELYANLTSELANELEKTTTAADERFSGVLRARRTWINQSEFFSTLQIVRDFILQLEEFLQSLSRISSSVKSFRFLAAGEIKSQTTEYYRNFHQKQTEIVNTALDRERWRVATPDRIKQIWPNINSVKSDGVYLLGLDLIAAASENQISDLIISDVSSNHSEDEKCSSKDSSYSTQDTLSTISGNDEENQIYNIRTAEVFFIILQVVAKYGHLVTVTCNAEVMLGVVDLLRGANARIAQLVVGAGAVELKICKSISVSNLAIVVRGLCLLAAALPDIREIFVKSLPAKNQHLLKHVDTVHMEINRHCQDVENKMVSIIEDVINSELSHWEARPPVPSIHVNNVSRSIVKFREAIAPMLTQKQISALFVMIDKAFRAKLKERIASLGIQKDGGPRHGVVTSEMMHYAENLRKLNVLPANSLANAGLTQELWPPKS